MTVTVIQTAYAGCRFRSRLEARWAVFFDSLGVPWRYEPQGYVVAGQPYLPDFWIGDQDGVWVEVKGELDRDGLAKLAAAAGPDGLPLRLGDDRRPLDMDFGEGRGWLDVATPVLRRLLLVGDIPDPADRWAHVALKLVNGRHVVNQLVAWWHDGHCPPLVNLDTARPLRADPPAWMPHGQIFAPLAHNRLVGDAYRAARSARFEHGESG